MTSGQRLRALREQFGLTIREVETASMKIAARHGTDEYAIPLSRLSDIETKGIVPNIYRLYSLAVIYRRDVRELMSWYGVDLNGASSDLGVIEHTKSHVSEALDSVMTVPLPVRLDPGFESTKTVNLGRMIEQWGSVPVAYLNDLMKSRFTYGYIGMEDFTMYPILRPGTFLQIDETKDKVVNGVWRSEYERPIYFVETRDGYTCSWCTLKKDQLILQSHPLSPVPVRLLTYPRDAEITGQVVGIAMKLGDWLPCQPVPEQREPLELN